MQDVIHTIGDLAELLKVGKKTIYSMAQRPDLPSLRVRGQWSFRRAAIAAWIEAQTYQARDHDGQPNGER